MTNVSRDPNPPLRDTLTEQSNVERPCMVLQSNQAVTSVAPRGYFGETVTPTIFQ